MYKLAPSRRYRTSYKRVSKRKEFDQKELDFVTNALARGTSLPPRYRDHLLSGDHAGVRECHIKNDLLLLYQKHDNVLVLLLIDIGAHSSLFGQ